MRLSALILVAVGASAAAAEPKPFSGRAGEWQGFAKHEFAVGERTATVVVPAKPLTGRPWVWRAEFFGAFADADAALVKAGWHLAYLSAPDLFGSPKAVAAWEQLYAVLTTEYELHPRPGIIGLSRGGLYALNWAAAHPDRTLAVYLDNAVCDFKSWPGGKLKHLGSGDGSAAEWKKLLAAYDFPDDAAAVAYKLNPVDNLAPLAKAKIPLLLVYGDRDVAVPHAENSAVVYSRYTALGGPVERIVKPGVGHHPHGLTDVSPVVKFFAAALAPEVRHEPQQPKPGEAVTVTARLPAGTTAATLKLQPVAPGKYVRKSDPAYAKDWAELPMQLRDGVFTATVPATYQKHRWLLRYRVVATDAAGKPVPLPAADSNFAWWCDGGPAAWTGSRDPGRRPAVTYPADFLGTLQSLHLLARMEDVAKTQWDPNFHKQKQEGTLVYRGVVYDHVHYSNRGQGSAHIAGKNKWGLSFGRPLPLLDHDGVPFPAAVTRLNLNPGGSTPYDPYLRGITGLDEVLTMRAYRLAGVPAPPATWVQWRVVASADEVTAKDQYAGDLWGVYVAVGDMDPNLLADDPPPDGLTVSIQSGVKHAPPGMAEPQKVWDGFLNGMRSNPAEPWWRENLDLPAYFSFHALNRLLGNTDLRPDGNHGYYRRPDGHWAPIPWDNDMMFVPRHHQPGYIDAIGCLRHPAIQLEYRNRAREILDLFAADPGDRGGQVGQLAADLGSALTPAGFAVDWPRLDAARWDQHPRINPKGVYFRHTTTVGHAGGNWTRTLATADFAGLRKYVVDFCTDSRRRKDYAPNDGDPKGYGWGYLNHEAKDDKIAATPTVAAAGGKYRFEASAFASPAGAKPTALEWRVGRVGQKGWYELDARWQTSVASGRAVEVPAEVFREPGEYRVRARWRDDAGRCGHWSAAAMVNSQTTKKK